MSRAQRDLQRDDLRAIGASMGIPAEDVAAAIGDDAAEWEISIGRYTIGAAGAPDVVAELIDIDHGGDGRFGGDISSRATCVYFVQPETTPYVKIGVTTVLGIDRRLAGLQIGNPHRLYLRRLVEGDYELEARLHARFAQYRMAGEWFLVDGDLAAVSRARG